MFSNKRKIHWGKILIISFVFILLYGYSLGDNIKDFYAKKSNIENENKVDIASKDNSDENEDNQDNDEDNQDNSVSTNYPQNIFDNNDSDKKISSNTVLICKTYDNDTNNIITNEIAVPSSLLNLTLAEAEDYIKLNYRNWVIKEVNEDFIEIYETNSTDIETSIEEEDNNLKKSYFLLKEEDGIVYIFEYDKNDIEQSKEPTNIEFNLIGENDQKLFEKGIKKYSEDELYELLQDFES